jgi:lipoprotein-anchoring transpeptidase ErfK/SrfK
MRPLAAIAVPFCLAACQTLPPPPDVPQAMPPADLERIGAALSAAPRSLAIFEPASAKGPLDPAISGIIVDLDRQRAYVYSNAALVAATRIASGKAGFRTPTGDFKIGQKNPGHSSNLYGKLVDTATGAEQPGEFDTRSGPPPAGMEFRGAPMRHFMRFHTPDGRATAIGFHQGHVPTRPASHGCIRLPGASAKALYKLVPPGTPVSVYGEKHGTPPRPLPDAMEQPPKKLKREEPSNTRPKRPRTPQRRPAPAHPPFRANPKLLLKRTRRRVSLLASAES